jgi:hypothetical protein
MSEISNYNQVSEHSLNGPSSLTAEAIQNNRLLRAAYEIESIVLVSEIELKKPIVEAENPIVEPIKSNEIEAETEEDDPAQLVEYNSLTGADHFGLSIEQPGEVYLEDYKSSADKDREIIIRNRDENGKMTTLFIMGNRIYDVEDSIKHGKPCGIILENGDDMPNPIIGQLYDANLPNARGKVEEVTIKVKGSDSVAFDQLPLKVVDNPYEEDLSPFEQVRHTLDNLITKAEVTDLKDSAPESTELDTDEEVIRQIISSPIDNKPTTNKTRLKRAMELASTKYHSAKEKAKSRRLRSAAVAAVAIVGAAVSLAVITDGSSNQDQSQKPFHLKRTPSEQSDVSVWVQEESHLENKLDKGTKMPKSNKQGKLPAITINLPSKANHASGSSDHTKPHSSVSYHSSQNQLPTHSQDSNGKNLSKIPGIVPKVG